LTLDFLLLADAAEVGSHGKVSILGGAVTRISPPALPFHLPHLVAIARLVAESHDQGRTHQASFRWLTPDGKQFGPALRQEFTVTGNDEEPDHGVVLIAEMVMLPLTEEGRHRFEFQLNNKPIGQRDVWVVLPKTGGDASA
jgi:hypothetical protein